MSSDNRRPEIAVGVDGSGESLVAAHWAALEGRRRGLGLRLIHGFTEPIGGYEGYALSQELDLELRNAAHHVLDVAAQSIVASFPDLKVSSDLVPADPRWALVEASGHALLTVVGGRGRGRVPEVLIGSVAQHVAAHGRSPVAVIPPGAILDEGRARGPILLGVDAAGSCEAAIGFAFDEAAGAEADLIAALVVDESEVPRFLRGPARPGSLQDREEQAALSDQLAGWAEKYPEVHVIPVVLHGRPAAALRDFGLGLPPGRHPRLIVVGSRGHTGLTSMVLGSTGRSLIAHAVWPVVVVRPGTAG